MLEQVRQVLHVLQLLQVPQVLQELHVLQAQAGRFAGSAQGFCGKMGREKNSSQTFSANSSQGGTEQNPKDGMSISTSAMTFRITVTQMVSSNVLLLQ